MHLLIFLIGFFLVRISLYFVSKCLIKDNNNFIFNIKNTTFFDFVNILLYILLYLKIKNILILNNNFLNSLIMFCSEILITYGLALSYWDFKTKTVPDLLNVIVFLSGLLMIKMYFDNFSYLENALIVIGASSFIFRFFLPVIFRREVMGEGDLLFLGLLGGLLGFKYFFVGLFIASLIYLLVYFYLFFIERIKEDIIPFIPILYVTFLMLWFIHPLEILLSVIFFPYV